MRFWDTSALVPLLLEQEATGTVRPLLRSDSGVVAWWGTYAECASAIARLRREEVVSLPEEERTLDLLERLRDGWIEILPSSEVQDRAVRLLRVHPLRAADALQLAAALVWSGTPRRAELVTLDERMGVVARLEGFRVLP